MVGMDQRTLDGSNSGEFYAVWVARGPGMQRMAERADGMILLTHEVGEDGRAWRLSVPTGTPNSHIVQILASLHDYCAASGMVAPRTWQPPGAEPESAPSKPGSAGVRASNTKQISIPLTDPNMAEKLRAALAPSVVRTQPALKSAELPE